MAAHHDDMPSTTSRPSARCSRVPAAPTTGTGSSVAGIGAYGCQTVARSRPIRPPTDRSWGPAATSALGRGPARAGGQVHLERNVQVGGAPHDRQGELGGRFVLLGRDLEDDLVMDLQDEPAVPV